MRIIGVSKSLTHSVLAIAYYFRIAEEAKRLSRYEGDDALKFLPRLRFHALALFGQDHRRKDGALDNKIVRNEAEFEARWSEMWPTVKTILVDVYTSAEEEGLGMFAFLRSAERWERMRKRFARLRVGE